MLDEDEKKWINELVESRMKDKTANYTTSSEFCTFLDKCMDRNREEKAEREVHLEKKSNGEKLFLSFFGMQNDI